MSEIYTVSITKRIKKDKRKKMDSDDK